MKIKQKFELWNKSVRSTVCSEDAAFKEWHVILFSAANTRLATEVQLALENQKQNKGVEVLHSFRFWTPNSKRMQVDFIAFTLFDKLETEQYVQ